MGGSTGFDGERYLRRLGERTLVFGERSHPGPFGDSPVGEAARALVAVGAIAAEPAQQIVDDYRWADALRLPGGPRQRLMNTGRTAAAGARPAAGSPPASRPASPPPAPAPAHRVARCRGVLEGPSETTQVRYAVLSSEELQIGVTIRSRTPGRTGIGMSRMIMGQGPQMVTVTDDRGTSVPCHFHGGGNEFERRGRLVGQPVSVDTPWLDLDGVRFQLEPAEGAAHKVSIEPLSGASAAHRYLWHWLGRSGRHFHHGTDLETLIGVLVDAGKIAADDPALDGMRYVGEWGNGPGRARRRMMAGQRTGTPPDGLPDAWASLLGRRHARTRTEGSLVVGATAPPLGGFRISVTEIACEPEGFTVETAVDAGDVSAFGMPQGIAETPLAWWTTDDRGNWYHGEVNSWSGAHGTLTFHPALDARASELRILPTLLSQRAVITVPLAWDGGD